MRSSRPITYLDSSALAKLVLRECGSEALMRVLEEPRRMVSSELAIVEVGRAGRLSENPHESRARWLRLDDALELTPIDPGLLQQAVRLATHRLRSLDAIHLASIVRVEPDVVITYDQRMAEAARDLAFRVEQPGRPG